MSMYSARPTTLRSGITLKTNYSVQHCSDKHIEEQKDIVRNAQTELHTILTALEVVKSDDEVDRLRNECIKIKEKVEKALIVLKLLYKINSELQYARSDVKNGEGEEITIARKRVKWLEDRMAMLCGKNRRQGQTGPRQSHKTYTTAVTFRSDSEDFSEQRALPPIRQRSGFSDDDPHSSLYTPSISGSEDLQDLQRGQRGMMDTPLSEASSEVPTTAGYKQVQEEESDISPSPQKQSSASSSERKDTSSGQSEAGDQLGDLPSVFQRKEFPQTSSPQPIVISAGIQEEDEEEDEAKESSEDDEGHEEKVEEEVKGQSEEVDIKDDENKQEKGEQKVQTEEKTFLTEVSAVTNKSRVTIVTPTREDTRQAFLQEVEEENRDVVLEYWQSEHHRFEYGDHYDIMIQLDPLSYHQMPLAVPGSFLQKYEKEFEGLPWRKLEKHEIDVSNVYKSDLDKLAKKVYRMYDKVFNATMLSVRPSVPENERTKTQSTILQSLDMSSKEPTMALVPSRMQASRNSLGGELSRMMATPPTIPIKMPKRLLLSKKEPPIVYYPKPIPPPEVLPLTRTTRGKEYPRLTESFTDPDPVKRKPAVRVCDQGKLAQETRLTLYKEKIRGKRKGPSTTEKKFRLMLQQEQSVVSTPRSEKTKSRGGLMVRMATKLSQEDENEEIVDDNSSEGSTWNKLKPKSQEYAGLKWERVKTIVHNNLASKRVEERVDASKHLGLLRCGDATVVYALKERMKSDEDQRVRYEAAKSLILVGWWEEEVIQVILKYLVIGNTEVRLDLIRTMIDGKNVQYVNKTINAFPELVKVLSHFCCNPDPAELISFEAAVLLGRLCVSDDNAKFKLKQSLEFSPDTHVKAKSLEILIKQLNVTDKDIVKSTLKMISQSSVWKHRCLAAELLITLGRPHVFAGAKEDEVYDILERRLWDDPTSEVRLSAAKTLTALGMFSKACEKVEKNLEDADEDTRSQAVISVGTLGMKNERIIRILLEMLELDSSDYVRLMVVRAFVTLKLTDKRVMRALRERERADGPLSRESKKAIKALESLTSLMSPVLGRKSYTPSRRAGSSQGRLVQSVA